MADKPTAVPGPQQISRYGNLWRRLFSIKAAAGAEPIAVLNLDNSYDALELAAIRGELPAWGSALAAAVAAQFSFVALIPNALNLAIRLEQMYLFSTAASIVRIGIANTQGGAVASAITGPRDSRFPLGNLSQQATVWSGSAGAIVASLGFEIPILAATPFWLPVPLVLAFGSPTAGTSVVAYNTTVNTDLRVGFVWRSRQAEPSEASPT